MTQSHLGQPDPPGDSSVPSERFDGLGSVESVLVQRGRLAPNARLVALDGGVSALIGLSDGDPPFVVKTARRRLAVRDDWFADPSRSLREGEILSHLDGRLGPMRVPRVLFVEPDLNLLGLEAFLPLRQTWREDLLAGIVDESVARDLGSAMAA